MLVGRLRVNENTVSLLDEFLVPIVADHNAIEFGASLPGVNTAFVRDLSDVEFVALGLMSPFNRSSRQIDRAALHVDPSYSTLIANKDLEFIKLEFFAVIRDTSSLGKLATGFSDIYYRWLVCPWPRSLKCREGTRTDGFHLR